MLLGQATSSVELRDEAGFMPSPVDPKACGNYLFTRTIPTQSRCRDCFT